jgi:hypothetical protein
MKMSALLWMMKEYPDIKEIEDMRKIIGRYGLTGAQQVRNEIRDTRKIDQFARLVAFTLVLHFTWMKQA